MSQRQIVVGIDGSVTARHALDWAATECDRRGAELVIAHAGDVEPGRPPRQDVPTDLGRSLLAEAEVEVYENGADCPVSTVIADENPVRLLTRLSEQAVRALYPDVSVQTTLAGDRIEDALRRAAEQASLLVLGSRYTGGHSHSRLGPVTARLLHRMPCPVLVVGHTESQATPPATDGMRQSVRSDGGGRP